ncbi:imidazole glycerol phosphate synthase subunit hisH [Leptospira ryugenii]|uniref:Imidazole glycerol phosphate synthase subunit HisH n=1 Tax=Leptospira ryugenii TaxID=1917863 RepID=A0A2P2DW16_9LEPT|nr:imidazole glycerol phosphate synthase subunit HisH [Leptospira ryugenii]GBF48816.1 imidazole glycerol phosphate synthase subunit hisH [Leptospira ryugenii]
MNQVNAKTIIVDYDMGNLFSVEHACNKVGLPVAISSDPKEILNAPALILPGVGAFADAMQNLMKFNLVEVIRDFAASGKPLMGICLGMQLLFTESEEFGHTKGLGIIDGRVTKFPKISPTGKHLPIPQINWNQIIKPESDSDAWENSPLFQNENGDYMYFIHSFYTIPERQSDILTLTNYEGFEYCSAIHRENVFALQFHPEKSGEKGILIYRSFRDMVMERVHN